MTKKAVLGRGIKSRAARTGMSVDKTNSLSGSRHLSELGGACAFSPTRVENNWHGFSFKEGQTGLRVGTGQLEFTDLGRKQIAEKNSGCAQDFSAAELLAICNAIEFCEVSTAVSARLVLLPISSRLVHAYWEIKPTELTALEKKYGDKFASAKLVLRFYEVTLLDNVKELSHFDIDVQGLKNNWFAHLWEQGKRYIAEIGYVVAENEFVKLAASNSVALPQETPANDNGHQFMFRQSNKELPAKPAVLPFFSLLAGKKEKVQKRVDSPCRDFEAEIRVRDVYKRFFQEGPRVLSNRPPFAPVASDLRVSQYRQRREKSGQKHTLKQIWSKAQPEIIPAACLSRKSIVSILPAEEQCLVRRISPGIKYPDQRNVDCRLDDLSSPADSGLDELDRMKIADHKKEQSLVRNNKPGVEANAECDFLYGLDVGLKPEPERYWASGKGSDKRQAKTRTTDLVWPSAENFCNGLELAAEANGLKFEIQANLSLKGKLAPGQKLVIAGKPVRVDQQGGFTIECSLEQGKINIPFAVFASTSDLQQEGKVSLQLDKTDIYPAWDKIRVVSAK